MKLFLRFLFALAITLPMLPVDTQAHFILLEPASWVTENQLGDRAAASRLVRTQSC